MSNDDSTVREASCFHCSDKALCVWSYGRYPVVICLKCSMLFAMTIMAKENIIQSSILTKDKSNDDTEPKKQLISLEEHNNKNRNLHIDSNESIPNGIACPKCGEELVDSNPNQTLLSYPPQKNIECIKCKYTGYRKC